MSGKDHGFEIHSEPSCSEKGSFCCWVQHCFQVYCTISVHQSRQAFEAWVQFCSPPLALKSTAEDEPPFRYWQNLSVDEMVSRWMWSFYTSKSGAWHTVLACSRKLCSWRPLSIQNWLFRYPLEEFCTTMVSHQGGLRWGSNHYYLCQRRTGIDVTFELLRGCLNRASSQIADFWALRY